MYCAVNLHFKEKTSIRNKSAADYLGIVVNHVVDSHAAARERLRKAMIIWKCLGLF